MDIERRGGNCVVIGYKKTKLVTDARLSLLGLKDQINGMTAQLATQGEYKVVAPDIITIDGPGEYEIQNCSVRGVAAQAYRHPDSPKKEATIYCLKVDEWSIVIVGHVKPKLTDEELEAIGMADVLVIPVGGYGYTLDPKEAVEVVRAIEPKIIIPTHYAEKGVTYEVPQAPLEDFLSELGAHQETVSKLKIKPGAIPDALTVYELSKD